MRSIAVFLSLTSLLWLTACRGPAPDGDDSAAAASGSAPDVVMRVETPDAPSVGPAVIEVFLLRDDDGVDGAEVDVVGDMTHAGMEPVIADAPMDARGLYRTDDFAFTMAGDWILTVTANLPDGERLRDEVTLTVRSP
ncbi:MAG: FixH family protein [Trueperaceae bacterium]